MTPTTYMDLPLEDQVESLRAAALTAVSTADGTWNAIRVNMKSQHPDTSWRNRLGSGRSLRRPGARDWNREVLDQVDSGLSDRTSFTKPARRVLLAADAESNTAIASKGWGVLADGDGRAQSHAGQGWRVWRTIRGPGGRARSIIGDTCASPPRPVYGPIWSMSFSGLSNAEPSTRHLRLRQGPQRQDPRLRQRLERSMPPRRINKTADEIREKAKYRPLTARNTSYGGSPCISATRWDLPTSLRRR